MKLTYEFVSLQGESTAVAVGWAAELEVLVRVDEPRLEEMLCCPAVEVEFPPDPVPLPLPSPPPVFGPPRTPWSPGLQYTTRPLLSFESSVSARGRTRPKATRRSRARECVLRTALSWARRTNRGKALVFPLEGVAEISVAACRTRSRRYRGAC